MVEVLEAKMKNTLNELKAIRAEIDVDIQDAHNATERADTMQGALLCQCNLVTLRRERIGANREVSEAVKEVRQLTKDFYRKPFNRKERT